MQLRATAMHPPWSYDGSAVLDAPQQRPSVKSIATRLARFRRDGFIDIGSRIMWFMWQREYPHDEGNALTRAYAPSLIALGCMYGGPPNLPRPTELEFRLLCWELHWCPEPGTSTSGVARQALKGIRERHLALPREDLLSKVPVEGLRHVWDEYVVGLVAQSQIRPFAFRPSDLVRALLVYEEFRSKLLGDAQATLRRLEQAFFGTSWEVFLRLFLLSAVVGGSDALGEVCPGRIDVFDADDAPAPTLGIQPRDLKLGLSRLATRVTEYQLLRGELESSPSSATKYHPAVRALDMRPVILLDDYEDIPFAVAIPSPWHLRMASETFVLDEFFAFAHANRDSHPLGVDPYGARGRAFEDYLSKVLAENPAIIDLDERKGSEEKRPDFLWVGQHFGIVIEAKVRMGPNTDPWGRNPMSIWESWRTGAHATRQGAAFLDRDCDGLATTAGRTWVLIIVTMQPAAAEATSFRTAAKAWNLLSGTKFTALAVVSPTELEHHAILRDPDAYARGVCQRWDDLDPWSLDRPAESTLLGKLQVPESIRSGWVRLFPDIPWPGESETTHDDDPGAHARSRAGVGLRSTIVASAIVGTALGGTTSAWMRALPMHIGSAESGRFLVGAITIAGLVAGAACGIAFGRLITKRARSAAFCLAFAGFLGAALFPLNFGEWSLGPLRQALEESLGSGSEGGLPSHLVALGRVLLLPLLVGASASLMATHAIDSGMDERHRRVLLALAAAGLGALAGHLAALLAIPTVGLRYTFYGFAALLLIAALLAFRERSAEPSSMPR